MMYEPQTWIDPNVYPYLVRWGLANGYEIKTNEPHTILYDIRNLDPIRGRELLEAGKTLSLNRCAAMGLVASLAKTAELPANDYDPHYMPPIRLDEEMFNDYFLPCLMGEGWNISENRAGIFREIAKVYKADGEVKVMCRSKVTETVRDCEYDRRMVPFIVKYQHRSTGKYWMKGIDSIEKAVEVLEREKPRHIRDAEWWIYQDMTAVLRHMDEIPGEVITVDDWLWMRIWHPGEYGGDYWSIGYFDNLKDQREELIQEEQLDMYAVTGLYACARHDPPPEKAEEGPGSKWHVVSTVMKPDEAEKELAGGVAVIWPESQRDAALWFLVTPDPDDIDAADLRTLNEAIRSDSVAPADRAMLYPAYKSLKIEDGIQYEKYVENGFADNGSTQYTATEIEGEDEPD